MRRNSIKLCVLVSLASVAAAGVGGISPAPGTYTFERLLPTYDDNVGSGAFSSPPTGSPNFTANSSTKWTQGGDGQYRKVVGGSSSVCFHATSNGTPPYTYIYKLDDDEVSSGNLQP